MDFVFICFREKKLHFYSFIGNIHTHFKENGYIVKDNNSNVATQKKKKNKNKKKLSKVLNESYC